MVCFAPLPPCTLQVDMNVWKEREMLRDFLRGGCCGGDASGVPDSLLDMAVKVSTLGHAVDCRVRWVPGNKEQKSATELASASAAPELCAPPTLFTVSVRSIHSPVLHR